ncbi:TetR/AcrR family transcriptional regulator [Kordiimonas sp.]|uniref:TetR/AcrR family transcriptional regulator n=1 Tax=Kordiimonas sp. TaxID=1970157 RepID=UPI003A9315D8
MRTLTLQGRHEKASSRKGRKRVEVILNTARDILIDEGYAALSMRRIAKMSGITVGNLSYYYTSKQDLVQDLLEAVIQGYMGWWDDIMADDSLTPEQQFAKIISFIIDDLTTKETTHFFPELWALANHEPFAQEAMNTMYGHVRDMLMEMAQRINPALSVSEREILAVFMSSSFEGHTMFLGYGRRWSDRTPQISHIAIRSFLHLIKTATPENINGFDPAIA